MFGLGFPELFILSLICLVLWVVFFIKKKHLAILMVSLLLVVINVPHLMLLNRVLNGEGVRTDNSIFFVLIFGIGCLVLGAFGLIYSAITMSRKSAT